MSAAPHRFPYIVRDPALGPVGLAPGVPIALALGSVSVDVTALLDSGAAVCVLPYTLGLTLGGDWDRSSAVGPLTGNLSRVECRGLVVTGRVGSLPPVRLAFAWAKTDAAPLILGQMNFFLEFDVCFHRSRLQVEIQPATKPNP